MAGVEGKGRKQNQREMSPPNNLCPFIKHHVGYENKSLFPRAMHSLPKHLPGGFSGLKNSRPWCLEIIYLCAGYFWVLYLYAKSLREKLGMNRFFSCSLWQAGALCSQHARGGKTPRQELDSKNHTSCVQSSTGHFVAGDNEVPWAVAAISDKSKKEAGKTREEEFSLILIKHQIWSGCSWRRHLLKPISEY